MIKEKVDENDRTAAKTPLLIFYAKLNSCIMRIRPLQNERQWSINDSWSCILGNLCGACSQTSVNHELAAYRGSVGGRLWSCYGAALLH